MEDRRITKDMFIQDVEGLDKKSKQSKVTKNKKIIINIIIIISLICLIALGLIFYFIFKKYSKEEEEENRFRFHRGSSSLIFQRSRYSDNGFSLK